jgi:DNA-binding NarL/FixJ family response regulator
MEDIDGTYKLFLNRFDKLSDRQIVVFLYEQMGVKSKDIAIKRKTSEQTVKHDKMAIRKELHCLQNHNEIVAFLIEECFTR